MSSSADIYKWQEANFLKVKCQHFVNSIVSNYFDFNTRLCCINFHCRQNNVILSDNIAKRRKDIRREGRKLCSKSAIKIL